MRLGHSGTGARVALHDAVHAVNRSTCKAPLAVAITLAVLLALRVSRRGAYPLPISLPPAGVTHTRGRVFLSTV